MSDVGAVSNGQQNLEPPGLDLNTRFRLSAMMLLQYATWGMWWVVLSMYIKTLAFTDPQVGWIYATMAIASIVSPLVFGQIADRWLPTQYMLAGMHIAGGGLLLLITQQEEFTSFFICVQLYALIYIPTISLTNSLSFHHVPDAEKHFPSIRVFGTIGWILAGLFVGRYLFEASAQPIFAAAISSFVLGAYCLTLPNTPPSGESTETLAFLRAFHMLKDKTFLLFIIVSFIISIILAGYFSFASLFLQDLNFDTISEHAGVATFLAIGQVTEMLLLPFLPFFLKRIGMKRTLALGMAAWGIRYGLFAAGGPIPLIIFGIALHGICYDFFFVAAYIHVDNRASRNMRASAQAFFNLVTMGLGMLFGNYVFGQLKAGFTREIPATLPAAEKTVEQTDWSSVWTYPAIAVIVVLIIFMIGFREKSAPVTVAEESA
jgi:nucleoside transporter